MKKIFTLLVCACIATVSFAQGISGQQDFTRKGNVAYHDNHDRDDDRRSGRFYYFSKKELKMQVADINQEYESRICEIKAKWFASSFRKQRSIRVLENERDEQIATLNAKFNSRFNKFNYQHSNNW